MRHYRGSEEVPPGIYLHLRHLSFKSMASEGRLPGTGQDEYRRVPTLALVAAGPVLGGLYVVFLPLAGFAMLAWLAAGKAAEMGAHAVRASLRVLRPAWEPARAFLGRSKPAKRVRGGRDGWAAEVEKDLGRAGTSPAEKAGNGGEAPDG